MRKAAERELKEVFGVDPSGLLRTQYDPSKEQEFFYLNNYYYVRRTEEAGASYKVLSREDLIDAKENVRGVAVKVAVMENNELESEVCMELLFAGEGEWMKLQKSSIVLSK